MNTATTTTAVRSRSPHHIWSSEECHSWINQAKDSTNYRGSSGNYGFHVISKLKPGMNTCDEDPRRAEMTEALAKLIYQNKNPNYRIMSLGFYDILISKLTTNQYTSRFMWKEIMVVLKGSNAYAMLIPNHPDLSFSDLDIAIYINPWLPSEMFKQLKTYVHIVLLQTMSQYKKTIDHMFFLDNPDPNIKYMWMNEETIQEFKKDHIETMRSIGAVSVFEDKETRNACSRNSFMLVNSNRYAEKVVRIDVPHFHMCHMIPLRKSPVFCSYNETIVMDTDTYKRDIGLYRIKFNSMMVEPMEEVRLNLAYDNDGNVSAHIEPMAYEDSISADFIDVTIASQCDSELIDFWQHGRCVCVREPATNVWVFLPDIPTCMADIYKMLNVYECPESKREKRQRKYDLMQSIIGVPPPPPR